MKRCNNLYKLISPIDVIYVNNLEPNYLLNLCILCVLVTKKYWYCHSIYIQIIQCCHHRPDCAKLTIIKLFFILYPSTTVVLKSNNYKSLEMMMLWSWYITVSKNLPRHVRPYIVGPSEQNTSLAKMMAVTWEVANNQPFITLRRRPDHAWLIFSAHMTGVHKYPILGIAVS